MALPGRCSQRNWGPKQCHTCLHLHKEAILEAGGVRGISPEEEGVSLPVNNSIRSKLGRVLSGGFLCFVLLGSGWLQLKRSSSFKAVAAQTGHSGVQPMSLFRFRCSTGARPRCSCTALWMQFTAQPFLTTPRPQRLKAPSS